MGMSDYMRSVREKVGHDLLLLPSAAAAIFDSENRMLLCLHSERRIWVAPGGLVEPGESPADAAARETWEETGLLIEPLEIIGVFGGPELFVNYDNGDRAAYIGTVFRARIAGGELRPDGTETLDLRYFGEEELRNAPHARWMDLAWDALFGPPGPARFQHSRWSPGKS
jgi:8-oxo-dGTP pyrophosphatase MutT (NUDIX family)